MKILINYFGSLLQAVADISAELQEEVRSVYFFCGGGAVKGSAGGRFGHTTWIAAALILSRHPFGARPKGPYRHHQSGDFRSVAGEMRTT